MKKSELSDKQLEEWLSSMPKVKDYRDPRDIYQNISLKLTKRKKRMVWVMPTIAAATALILIFILASNQLFKTDSEQFALDSRGSNNKNAKVEEPQSLSDEMKKDNNEDITKKTGPEDNQNAPESLQNDKQLTFGSIQSDETEGTTAVYQADLADHDVITYAIPDENAQITVPVSVLIPKNEKSVLENWEKTMSEINEGEWGLGDFYPINGDVELNKEGNQLNIDVPSDHQYGMGSTSPDIFIDALQQLLDLLDMNKMTLSTEGNPGIDLGNYGPKTEITLEPQVNHAYYLLFPANRDEPFMVPSREKFDSVEKALLSMKKDMQPNLKASIPEHVEVNTNEASGDALIVNLDGNGQIQNNLESEWMIEAILLTAKSFNFKEVKFENTKVNQIGQFNLSENLEVPIAANKEYIKK